jgi:hypothetical protein
VQCRDASFLGSGTWLWPLHVIEEALGDDADGILRRDSECELRVRLPRHHIDMLKPRAEQQETTISGVLERELDGIASAHIEELLAALPGSRRRWLGRVRVGELLVFAVSGSRGCAVSR